MKCPHCRATNTEVFNSRTTKFGNQVWRRRRCMECQATFTTYEAPDLGFLQISKRHGKTERYSRAKLFSSIYSVFDIKNQQDAIDAVTDTVEAKLLELTEPELAAAELAQIVLQTLKHYNTTAFVRYLAGQTDLANEAALRKELKKY